MRTEVVKVMNHVTFLMFLMVDDGLPAHVVRFLVGVFHPSRIETSFRVMTPIVLRHLVMRYLLNVFVVFHISLRGGDDGRVLCAWKRPRACDELSLVTPYPCWRDSILQHLYHLKPYDQQDCFPISVEHQISKALLPSQVS